VSSGPCHRWEVSGRQSGRLRPCTGTLGFCHPRDRRMSDCYYRRHGEDALIPMAHLESQGLKPAAWRRAHITLREPERAGMKT